MTDNIYSPQKTAEKLGISEATARNWEKLGIAEDEYATKLKSRANKRQSSKLSKPREYCANENLLLEIDRIVSYTTRQPFSISAVLCLVAERLLPRSQNSFLRKEHADWKSEIERIPDSFLTWFSSISLEETEGDILGLLYQSLLSEGSKAKNGSYYTPQHLVHAMISAHCMPSSTVLDPACGTGQFLLESANFINDPTQLYGIDNDPIAVRICRINLMLRFPEIHFNPNVICADTLFDFHVHSLFDEKKDRIPIHFFDLVMTNPPWGAHYSPQQKKQLTKLYPHIRSGESYSYFLLQAIRFAKRQGAVSFVLPESILNIKAHADIREYLIEHIHVNKIHELGRVFHGVFTPVVRLDISNTEPKQKRSADAVFSVFRDDRDQELLEKIDSKSVLSLKNNAKFALGIVTGNNEKHLHGNPTPKSEPIYRGKNVDLFVLKPSTEYLVFQPDRFQQVAQEGLYRADEKLIYRFISKDLLFAYDAEKRLTLNSANVLIPTIPDYPAKVLCAVLNSDLMRFVYRKKFNALKVLRGNLEELPIPDLAADEKSILLELVDRFIQTKKASVLSEINDCIFEHFRLNRDEKEYITSFLENN